MQILRKHKLKSNQALPYHARNAAPSNASAAQPANDCANRHNTNLIVIILGDYLRNRSKICKFAQ